MKKILSLFFIIILLTTGCGKNTSKDAVESYLKKYKNLNSEVLVDLEKEIENRNLNEEQENIYREVLKKQYKDLSYEIVEEDYDDEVSYVTVKISVYDYYKAENDADVYLKNNPDEFNNENGDYDEDKFINFKLERMKDTTEKQDYTIIFTVTKEKDKYEVVQPTEEDLKKLHGVYNYELQ